MKRIMSLFLGITMMVFIVSGTAQAADTQKITIENYEVSQNHIYDGDKFYLTLTLKNNTSSDMQNLTVDINSSSFGDHYQKVQNIKANESATVKIDDIKYNGGNDEKIYIEIKSNDTTVCTKTISINEAYPDDDGSKTSSTDTSGYKPRLNVEKATMPSGIAGQNLTLKLKIKNNGSYQAKKIEVTPVIDSDVFETRDITLLKAIKELPVGKTAELSYTFKIKSSAAPKNYPITLKYSYENLYDNAFNTEEVIYIRVGRGLSKPNLVLSNVKTSPQVIQAGKTGVLSFDVTNKGAQNAKNINASLVGLDKSGLTLKGNINNVKLNTIYANGKQKDVKFNIYADPKMEDGNYPISIKLQYTSEENEVRTEEQQFFVRVNKEKNVSLSVDNVKLSSEVVVPNEAFSVSLDVENISNAEGEDITVSIDGKEKIINKSQSLQLIKSLKSGEKRSLTFQLAAVKGDKSENYLIPIEVKYGDKIIKQYTSVYVQSDAATKSEPKIIINRYETDPEIVTAGTNFNINISFLNTHISKSVKNVKIYLTVDEKDSASGNVFTPVNSSNTFYIDEIASKADEVKQLTMNVLPDAKAKTYSLIANIEYEDAEGNKLTAKEIIGIPVTQPSNLGISEIQLPPELYVGEPATISVQFYNTGKTTMNNFMVKAEGNFDIKNGEYFVGNFENGKSDTYEVDITPKAAGEVKGTIVFSYDEADGEHREIRKEILLNASDAPMLPENPEQIAPENVKKPLGAKKTGIIIGVIVAAVVAGIVIRKRKIKKGLTIDE
ncbi:COG1361 S-layer family protein [Clostridium sp. ZS2-4]|uniref:COG1361 S-layer family protein n=1 Tax=Clostridium sp. ZS2-4 TaxID=2987703 RepID=UPI00227C39AB|nr:CARDB domain-containing protein [Clostridium sp. ZS2-4]MCY6353730.1 hypothetical protein [Clostridium sp. ZS2-4]